MTKICPRCKGDIRIDRDEYGWYEQCITCGYLRDLVEIKVNQKASPERVKGT